MEAKSALATSILVMLIIVADMALAIPRHVNPETVQEDIYAPVFLLLYTEILDFLAREDFNQTYAIIERSYAASIPPTIKYLYQRTLDIIKNITTLLNETKVEISLASKYLDNGFYGKALAHVEYAEEKLLLVKVKIKRLKEASLELSRVIHIPVKPLEDRIAALVSLTARYEEEIDLIKEVATSITKERTKITIWVNTTQCSPGDYVLVEGVLATESGEPLVNQEVVIYGNGMVLGRARTLLLGNFYKAVRIPEIYVPQLKLYAAFRPPKYSEYTACMSQPINISLIYRRLFITAKCDKQALIGGSFRVQGNVTLDGEPVKWSVIVKWLDETYSLETNATGFFTVTLAVPKYIDEGTYTVLVRAPGGGGVAPASTSLYVYLSKLIPSINITEVPLIALGAITLRGVVDLGIPWNASIPVEIYTVDVNVTVYTDPDGFFEATLFPPIYSLSGYKDVHIRVTASEQHVEEREEVVSVLYLNPVTLIAIAIILLIVMPKHVATPRKTTLQAPEPEEPATVPISYSRLIKRVLFHELWWRIAGYAERVTGRKVEPWHTLREYTSMVYRSLGRLGELFWKICVMAEIQLYSPRKPEKTLYEKVKELVHKYLERGDRSG